MNKLITCAVFIGLLAATQWHEHEVGHYQYIQGCVRGVNGVISGMNAAGIQVNGPNPEGWCEAQYKAL